MIEFRRVLREHYLLLLSGIAITVSTPLVTNMLIRAWESPGRLRESIHGLGDFLGVGFEVVVVFPTGLYIGLLTLFLLDESKKLQAILVLLLTVIGAGILISGGHWIDYIDWSANIFWAIFGYIIALPLGGVVHLIRSEAPREFPRASRIIIITLVISAVIGFVEAHLRYTGPEAFSVEYSGLLADFFFAVVFILTLGYFLSYAYRQDVFVISSNGTAKTGFMAELFHYTRTYRKAREWGKYSAALNSAVTDLQLGNEVSTIRGDLRLRFRTENWLARWVSVVTDESKVQALSDGDINRLANLYNSGSFGLRLRKFIDSLPFLFGSLRANSHGFTRHIKQADIVILLLDTTEVFHSNSQEELDKFDSIQNAIGSHKQVVLVAMNAEAGLEAFNQSSYQSRNKGIENREFRIFLRSKVFGERDLHRRNPLDPTAIVPVSRSDDDQFARGTDEVVKKLEPSATNG
jgi:hypothetical protein